MTGWSMGPGHELRQLGAGIYPELGERIVDVVFHRMEGKVQLCGDGAVGHALCDQVDHLELGVGEAVPARFCPSDSMHDTPTRSVAHSFMRRAIASVADISLAPTKMPDPQARSLQLSAGLAAAQSPLAHY